MATRKRASTRKTTTTRSTTTRRSASTRRSTSRRRTTRTYSRRRRPGLPTTLGAALGTLVVTTLLDASWPVRIGLVVAVVVAGLAYVVWKNRSEIAAAGSPGAADSTSLAAETTNAPSTPVNPPDPTVNQGDSTHE